ncbi:MAG: histidine kinase, partial [Bacillota bacterium]|nr:histidine kinase [Bacillota bacterium]
KIIIFIICLAVYSPKINETYMIVPILAAVILSSALSYFDDDKFLLGIYAVYIITCFFQPKFIFFIPLICYDAICTRIKWIWIFALLPLSVNFSEVPITSRFIIIAFIIVAYILKYHTVSLQKTLSDYRELRDSTKELSIRLEKKNKEMLEKQDYEINLATLKERNRIARDIHDNVGHMLSRSILQIGALLAINKDENIKENLRLIKDTLSEAMDSIRSSVHDLHEESIDLQSEIQKLVYDFKFCAIKFDYDVETNIDKNIKYCFIAITKEALSNIINHSNATEVTLIIREHPALYQFVVQDNGSQGTINSENGIGLKNISERTVSLGGNVNISNDKGFRIFISIPKNRNLKGLT